MNPPDSSRKPRLTIGMATHSDFYGVWQTLTDLRLDFLDLLPDIELVVVDNGHTRQPGSHSLSVQHLIGNIAEGMGVAWDGTVRNAGTAANRIKGIPPLVRQHPADIKYEILTDQGTSQSRNRIFEIAAADVVVVMDCHVKLWPNSLQRLLAFYDAGLDAGNLLQGPLIYDNFSTYHTHMDDIIRGNMRGIWGIDKRGFDLDADPFEIPGHGLGMFSCRKDAWLGFNKRFRGFGGEEYYIHEKFKAANKQTLCLPFLRWVHRFDRPGGTGYQNDLRHRIRNYLIGYQELGMPIDRLRSYFRDRVPEDRTNDDPNRGYITWADWDALCLDLGVEP